jgi:hypothetical protein
MAGQGGGTGGGGPLPRTREACRHGDGDRQAPRRDVLRPSRRRAPGTAARRTVARRASRCSRKPCPDGSTGPALPEGLGRPDLGRYWPPPDVTRSRPCDVEQRREELIERPVPARDRLFSRRRDVVGAHLEPGGHVSWRRCARPGARPSPPRARMRRCWGADIDLRRVAGLGLEAAGLEQGVGRLACCRRARDSVPAPSPRR